MAPADHADLMVKARLHQDIANRATDAEVRRLNDAMAQRYAARADLVAAEDEPAMTLP